MKIKLDNCSLNLMTTLGCNASCAHCYLSCSPAKARYRLSLGEMEHAIEDAKNAGLNNVCFTGGEPFIFPEDLFRAINTAKDLDMCITIRTNGFWAVNDKIAMSVLYFLKFAGVSSLGLSYDNYHNKFISASCLKRILRFSNEFEIEVWVDWVGRAGRKRVWQVFGDSYMPQVRYLTLPVWVGRARFLGSRHFTSYSLEEIQFDLCHSFRCGGETYDLFVYPGGLVDFSCCCYASPFIRPKPSGRHWVTSLIKEAESDPALNFLYEHGVGGLIRKAQTECPALLKSWYFDDCDACLELLPKLFPRKDNGTEYLFSEDGYCYSKAKAMLMSKRLAKRVMDTCPFGGKMQVIYKCSLDNKKSVI